MMRPAAFLTLALAATACGQAPAPPPAASAASDTSASTVVLSGFTLIDGNGGAPLPNAALVAQDGRITFVGPASELKAPAGATAQDLSGKFVLPGLIDLHVHVAESDGAVQDPRRTFTRENVQADLRLYANYGVTSVLSMGSDQPLVWDIRDEQHRERPKVARIFTAGRGFTGLEAFPTNQGNIPGIPYEVSDPKQAAGFVDELAAHHPDVVKIWVDDRFGDFAKTKTPINLAAAIIDEAHKLNLKVAAHVFYLEDAKGLAAAGLNAFAHSVRDKPVDDELIGLMKKHGTWQIATLTRDSTPFEFEHPEPFLNDPFFTKAAPPLFLERLKSPEYLKAMVADKHWSQYPGVLENAKRNLKRLVDAGVRYGFGTDAGVPGRVPAYLAHEELLLMRDAGLTPMQIIVAATKSSAEFLGERDLGTIEKGKWADLLVLGADPLADLKNSRKIDAVYVAGNKVN
ncbi:MAG: amidohydrolase family protein [Vicinamibacterales bacterium]|nr:amidohydrolase family protein [Vicinamibacterales bacterium]